MRADIKKRANNYREQAYVEVRKTRQDRATERPTGTKASNYVANKYRVSEHAVERFFERVLKIDFTRAMLTKGAMAIDANRPMTNGDGKHEFMNDYVAVIKSGIIVTIMIK